MRCRGLVAPHLEGASWRNPKNLYRDPAGSPASRASSRAQRPAEPRSPHKQRSESPALPSPERDSSVVTQPQPCPGYVSHEGAPSLPRTPPPVLRGRGRWAGGRAGGSDAPASGGGSSAVNKGLEGVGGGPGFEVLASPLPWEWGSWRGATAVLAKSPPSGKSPSVGCQHWWASRGPSSRAVACSPPSNRHPGVSRHIWDRRAFPRPYPESGDTQCVKMQERNGDPPMTPRVWGGHVLAVHGCRAAAPGCPGGRGEGPSSPTPRHVAAAASPCAPGSNLGCCGAGGVLGGHGVC